MLWRCCVALLALAGCVIGLDDVPGRACDEQHPCRLPRTCVANACVEPLSDGGADAGPPDAGPPVDAGLPRWQQRLHGFTGTTVDPGCTLDIDPLRGNRVLATIAGPGDGQDTATAELTDLNRLPRGVEGRLRGRLTLPAAVQVRGFVPVLFLGTQTGQAFVRAGFDGQGRLRVESDAQTLGATPLVETFTIDGGLTAGDWILELAWRAGDFREVRLNDVVLATTPVTGGATAPPGELTLGPARYDGDAGAAFSLTLSGWQLADELAVPLGTQP
ncbi:MAG: hypothetical protein ACOZQL_16035 [Myxococcota bacterium]